MPNPLGLIFWTIGILFIMISTYLGFLILVRYKHKEKFKIYLYLSLFVMLLFIVCRFIATFYSNSLNNLGLPSDILLEKILFVRMFINIPFAIATTLILFVCYSDLIELKYKIR